LINVTSLANPNHDPNADANHNANPDAMQSYKEGTVNLTPTLTLRNRKKIKT